MNKKQLIDDILYESLNIDVIELQNAEDGKIIKTIYSNNKIINSAIKKHRFSFLREYNDTYIVRDEVYATYYEDLFKLIEKENYTDADLELIAQDLNTESYSITKEFIKKLSGYISNDIKQNLNDPTRRSQSNNEYKLIETKIDYYDSYSKLELLIKQYDESEPMNEFIRWFNNNKELLLTDTQLSYIDNDKVYDKVRSEYSVNYKIQDRLNKSSITPQTKEEAKEKNILNKINTIESILDIEDPTQFIEEVKKKQSRAYISDAIIDYVPANHRINFNKNNITKDTLKAYRKALFRKIDELSRS